MIIWIASYPKSGNTWVRSLLSTYLHSNDGNFNFNLLKNILKFPSKKYLNYFLEDFSDIKKVSKYWIAAQERMNLFNENKSMLLKTHSALCTLENNSFTDKNNTQAVIYVVRDPRNVILSLKNHYNLEVKDCFNFLINDKNFICIQNKQLSKGYTPILDWSANYLSWKKQQNINTIFVKFEDLVFDQKNTFIYILNELKKYINLEIDQNKIQNIVKTTNFQYLRQLEEKEGFIENKIMGIQNNNKFFFNKGAEQDFNKDLEKNIINEVNKKYKELLTELNYLKN